MQEKQTNIFNLETFVSAAVAQAYGGMQVMNSRPYSWHSTAGSQLMPINVRTVYCGFIHTNNGSNITLSVRGQDIVLTPASQNTLVFFDSITSATGNIQFIGFLVQLASTT